MRSGFFQEFDLVSSAKQKLRGDMTDLHKFMRATQGQRAKLS